MKTVQEIVNRINGLLAKNKDMEKAYRKCAKSTSNPILRNLFNGKAEERHVFGNELKNEIFHLGGEVQQEGTLRGDIHRMWIDVKTLMSSNEDEVLLEECKHGEEAFIKEYKTFLGEVALPETTRKLLNKQLTSVMKTRISLDILEGMES